VPPVSRNWSLGFDGAGYHLDGRDRLSELADYANQGTAMFLKLQRKHQAGWWVTAQRDSAGLHRGRKGIAYDLFHVGIEAGFRMGGQVTAWETV
jgi:hypothetical protein